MKLTVLSMMALGAVALGSQVLAPMPAHAACSDDVMMTKEMAMKVTDAEAKEMALKHVAMAQEKADASMEEDCMAEVVKAKAAIDGKEMMEDKKAN